MGAKKIIIYINSSLKHYWMQIRMDIKKHKRTFEIRDIAVQISYPI